MLHLIIAVSISITVCNGATQWSYHGNTGPSTWCNVTESCCGKRQSPIDLSKKKYLTPDSPLTFKNYSLTPESITLTNNGHSVAISFSKDITPVIEGGGLNGSYIFDSLHFHWGETNDRGSEHTIKGHRYPMEMHMVHYCSRFKNLQAAIESGEPDALAVLGILYSFTHRAPRTFKYITSQFQSVKFNGQTTQLTPFRLGDLLPESTRVFYRYFGSLTTPNCDQVVVWTVFKDTYPVTKRQMAQFRSLVSTAEGEEPPVEMSDNFRPIQQLNGRTVYFVDGVNYENGVNNGGGGGW